VEEVLAFADSEACDKFLRDNFVTYAQGVIDCKATAATLQANA
jgi:hypothetical protein